MRSLFIDNYIINTPIIDILQRLRLILTNGKLREIQPPTAGSDNIVVTCPNNNHSGGREAHAACNIYIGDDTKIDYGYFRCFVCGEKGDFVKFVSECFNSSRDYAKEWLITNFGTLNTSFTALGEDIRMPSKIVKKKATLNPAILEGYQTWCPYLAKRKLNPDVCIKFNIKYDPKTRQIIFPCYDTDGDLVMLAKRSIDYKTFYMDKNVEKPVYCLDKIVKNDLTKVLLVEGPIDALTCWSHNIPAIAILGTPSEEQIKAINKSCLKSIYIATDNDAAGEAFAQTLDKKLSNRIFRTRINLPAGRKDANDLTEDEWQNLIEKYELNSLILENYNV